MSYNHYKFNLMFFKISEYARKSHDDANCTYDGKSYMVHVLMVVYNIREYSLIFKNEDDINTAIGAAYLHDLQEDARQTHNDISKIAGKDVADVVLAVTDVPAENRLMRHLLTMPKTVKDHRAIILKMCDILANAGFSKTKGSGMHAKYIEEYEYRKPIFKKALTWYQDKLNMAEVDKLWLALDAAHTK